jgi:hypothetical protein
MEPEFEKEVNNLLILEKTNFKGHKTKELFATVKRFRMAMKEKTIGEAQYHDFNNRNF